MRVISFNANGIRSAAGKGFFTWLAAQNADVICVQETRAQSAQLLPTPYYPPGYRCYYHAAERKGYSGVAVYTRREPDVLRTGLGWPECDAEGRWLEARFGALSVVSLYLPSGSSSPERQAVKFDFLARLVEPLQALCADGRDVILCGDWNMAHKEIDLKNWRANRNYPGFLPEERAWLDGLFGPLGWVDAFRVIDSRPAQYTWWSNRGRARATNVGWRIDSGGHARFSRQNLRRHHLPRPALFRSRAPHHGLRLCLLRALTTAAGISYGFLRAGGC